MVQGHLQDFSTLSNYMRQFTEDQFLMAMSDFHVLLYIATMDMLPLRVCTFVMQQLLKHPYNLASLLLVDNYLTTKVVFHSFKTSLIL